MYSSFENLHVYPRLNAINIRQHICTVDIHYLEGIRDINSQIEMANKDMYEQLLVEDVLNFQKSVSCESRFEYKFINFFSGLLCNF